MQQTGTEGVNEQVQLGEKGDSQGIVQMMKIWSYWQMMHAQTRTSPTKGDVQNPLGF